MRDLPPSLSRHPQAFWDGIGEGRSAAEAEETSPFVRAAPATELACREGCPSRDLTHPPKIPAGTPARDLDRLRAAWSPGRQAKMGKGRAGTSEATGQADPKRRKLVGYANFVRNNPRSDKFEVRSFHHVEFWCADAINTARRFSHALGMPLVGRSDQSSSNSTYASYTLKSNDLVFVFTSPYSKKCIQPDHRPPMPWYNIDDHWEFLKCHGMGVRAVGWRPSPPPSLGCVSLPRLLGSRPLSVQGTS